jgi:hypothetical protein
MRIVKNASYAALLPLLMGTSFAHAGEVRPYTATYEAIRDGDPTGTSQFVLRKTSAGWNFQSSTRATHGMYALLGATESESSATTHNEGRLELRSYESKLSGAGQHKRKTTTADPVTGMIAVDDGKHSNQYPMQPGVVDKMSLTIAIAEDLASGKRGTLDYPVAGREHIDVQHFTVVGEHTVTVPAGSMRAIEVSRRFDGDTNKATTYWFGIDNGYVPVRILLTESNGAVTDLRLSSLNR